MAFRNLTLGKSKILSAPRCLKFSPTNFIKTMLKKLFTLAAVLLLISCQSKMKTGDKEDKAVTEIENYQTLDEQQAASLNQQAQEVEVQDRINFGYDSAELTDESKKILNTQVEWLKSDTGIKITIEGHCDESGTREYNIALGEKRANAAKNYLTSNGIDSTRIKIISYGKERPAFFGNSEEILAKNRRAVAVVN